MAGGSKKQEYIAQIMSSKIPARSCEDIDAVALGYAEIMALCAGNPLFKEKIELDIEVAKLRMLRSSHNSQHYHLEDSLIKLYPQKIASSLSYRAYKKILPYTRANRRNQYGERTRKKSPARSVQRSKRAKRYGNRRVYGLQIVALV
jgi:hypothetical protein